MITKQVISENQRTFLFKNQQFEKVLTPGVHKFWKTGKSIDFVNYDINKLYFVEQNAERLYANYEAVREHLTHYKLSDVEVGLLYLNDVLRGVVAPGEHLYLWKDVGDIRLDKFDISIDYQLNSSTLFAIEKAGANMATKLVKSVSTVAIKPVFNVKVKSDEVALLYVDGKLVDQLGPGQYGYWQFNRVVDAKVFDCRTQLLDISGQEILSKDRVSLRINLSASIKLVDPKLAASSISDLNDYVYKVLQLALREAVGTKVLDDLLLDKLYVNETVKELVQDQLAHIGVYLVNVGMKDIILPGEMKTILNQVVEAQKSAEANVIKRREETAATRSLHNTAKVMENNPTLMRLNELEALEKVADKVGSLTVYDGLKGVMNGLVKIAE